MVVSKEKEITPAQKQKLEQELWHSPYVRPAIDLAIEEKKSIMADNKLIAGEKNASVLKDLTEKIDYAKHAMDTADDALSQKIDHVLHAHGLKAEAGHGQEIKKKLLAEISSIAQQEYKYQAVADQHVNAYGAALAELEDAKRKIHKVSADVTKQIDQMLKADPHFANSLAGSKIRQDAFHEFHTAGHTVANNLDLTKHSVGTGIPHGVSQRENKSRR